MDTFAWDMTSGDYKTLIDKAMGEWIDQMEELQEACGQLMDRFIDSCPASGNCYEVSVKLLLAAFEVGMTGDWLLCHGEVYHPDTDWHDHVWIEVDGRFALEFSNGNRQVMPVAVHARISNARGVLRFTLKQVRECMDKTGEYGPWTKERKRRRMVEDELVEKAKQMVDEVQADDSFSQKENADRLEELGDYCMIAAESVRSFLPAAEDVTEEELKP